MVIYMAESIEERLLREELDLYNYFVIEINELISKIVNQFKTKLPANHEIVRVWDPNRSLMKVAWPLDYDDINDRVCHWLTTEGYFISYLVNLNKRFMIIKFDKISSVGDKIYDENKKISIILNSDSLKYYLSILNEFYSNNQN